MSAAIREIRHGWRASSLPRVLCMWAIGTVVPALWMGQGGCATSSTTVAPTESVRAGGRKSTTTAQSTAVPRPARTGVIGPVADLQAIQNAFENLARRVAPSVVTIKSVRYNVRPPATREVMSQGRPRLTYERRTSGAGSGVIVRADGMILTNEHVIHDAEEIVIHLNDGREFLAYVVQIDPRSDLAVLQIETHGLTPAVLGDVATVKQGHLVFAMGNPFGVASEVGNASLSWGLVSALGRPLPLLGAAEDRYYGNLIETTAPINPGNSGGPLFDIYGRVIGINTAISTRTGRSEGVGFAVPICPRTRRIIDTLLRGDEVEYGLLGVMARTPDDHEREAAGGPKTRGALVESLDPGSPAEKAQIRPGDLIIRYDGQDVFDADHLVRMVGSTSPGQPVDVTFLRNRKTTTLQLALARRERTGTEDTAPVRWRGLMVVPMTPDNRRAFNLSLLAVGDAGGLIIAKVRPGSPAEQAGAKPGMVVTKIGEQTVGTLRQLRQAIRATKTQPAGIALQDGTRLTIPAS